MKSLMRRSLVVSALGALAVGVGAQAGVADKVDVCHGTASAKNMYVLITIDVNGLNGHLDGTDPGHGWKNYPDMVYDPVYETCAAQYDAEHGGDEE